MKATKCDHASAPASGTKVFRDWSTGEVYARADGRTYWVVSSADGLFVGAWRAEFFGGGGSPCPHHAYDNLPGSKNGYYPTREAALAAVEADR
jgi:hypothetical protein